MKKTLLFILLAGLFFSCQKKEVYHSQSQTELTVKQIGELLENQASMDAWFRSNDCPNYCEFGDQLIGGLCNIPGCLELSTQVNCQGQGLDTMTISACGRVSDSCRVNINGIANGIRARFFFRKCITVNPGVTYEYLIKFLDKKFEFIPLCTNAKVPLAYPNGESCAWPYPFQGNNFAYPDDWMFSCGELAGCDDADLNADMELIAYIETISYNPQDTTAAIDDYTTICGAIRFNCEELLDDGDDWHN